MFKEKRSDYKKEVRRQQINQIFKKKRKQFIQQHKFMLMENQKIQDEITEISSFINHDQNFSFTPQQIKNLAYLSTTKFGSQAILKSQIAPKLTNYLLQEEFINTKQQQNVTLIYANILSINMDDYSNVPPKQFVTTFVRIVKNSQQLQTKQNCLMAIYHLIYDYQHVRDFAIEQVKILDCLYQLLDQFPHKNLILQCLRILYVLILKSQDQFSASFKKFIKFYSQIVQNSNDQPFLVLSTFNFHKIISRLDNYAFNCKQRSKHPIQGKEYQGKNSDIVQSLNFCINNFIKSSGIKKIMDFSIKLAKQDYFIRTLQIIQISRGLLKTQFIQKNVLPYLKFIYIDLQNRIEDQSFYQKKAEIRTNNKINVYELKLKCNQFIYGMVNSDVLQLKKIFIKCDIYSYLLLNLQEQTDQSMIDSLIHIFGILFLSRQLDNDAVDVVMKAVERIRNRINLNKELYQFMEILQSSYQNKII